MLDEDVVLEITEDVVVDMTEDEEDTPEIVVETALLELADADLTNLAPHMLELLTAAASVCFK